MYAWLLGIYHYVVATGGLGGAYNEKGFFFWFFTKLFYGKINYGHTTHTHTQIRVPSVHTLMTKIHKL